MARLKQLEPKKETIGGLNFYIRPFPAMVAANLTGDLASLLTPVLAALMPLVGNSDNESDGEDGDLMDMQHKLRFRQGSMLKRKFLIQIMILR